MGLDALPSVVSANTGIGSKGHKVEFTGSHNGGSRHQHFASLLSQLTGGQNKYNQQPQSSGPLAGSPALPAQPSPSRPGTKVDIYA